MATLYRKYRPKTFSDMSGQEHVTATLQAALARGRLAHAYLFHGARGTGKTTAARILAREAGAQGVDIIEIDAASNRGIDDIRSLRDNVALSPLSGKYKAYIIDEVHMLTKEAFAALLKTLEEPVKHALFILATTEPHKVPATIVSRCQVYRFKRATDEELTQRLTWILAQEGREISPEALEFIISRSDGCYRDAESLLGQVLTWREGNIAAGDLAEFLGLPEKSLLERFLGTLVAGEAAGALAAIDEVYGAGLDPDQFLHEAIRTARDTVVALARGEKSPAWVNAQTALTRMPVIIRALLTALQDLAYVPEPKIALQLAVMSVGQTPTPRQNEGLPLPAKSAGKLQGEQTQSKNPSRPPFIKGGGKKRSPLDKGEPERISKVQKVWDQLIQNVKPKNPVASTFLRAVVPVGWNGAIVSVRAQYALHRNFFEKPENKTLIEDELGKLLNAKITLRFQLDESGLSPGIALSQVRQQEEELYNTVKEVFKAK